VTEQESFPMPFASLLHDRLLAGMAKEREEMDWSALGLAVMEVAGLKLPSSAEAR
jgi:hypothetical protein